MKTTLYLLPLGMLLSFSLQAQEEPPKADVFFGYSFMRYNSAQTIPAFTANGGIGTFAWNFNRYIAAEAELGGYHNGNVNNYQFDSTSFSYLFGPRLSLGRQRRIDPYFHILFGGQNFGTSIGFNSVLVVNPGVAVNPLIANPSNPTISNPICNANTPCITNTVITRVKNGHYEASQNTFAMAVGGGLDIRLTKLITLRPVQVDYYMTRFEAPDITVLPGTTVASARSQHDFRYAAGIAFNFGGGH